MIGAGLSFASSYPTADFSEPKSSDNRGKFGKIAPVESDGLWCLLDPYPLVLGTEPVGVVLWALAFRKRSTHRTSAAMRARKPTPPTTLPAITPLFVVRLATTGLDDDTTGGLFVEDVV